jgi:transmembrane sensor
MTGLIVLGLWGPNLMRPPPPAWTLYSSTKGRIRRVVLADGSVVRLNGASKVRVVFEDGDRRASLGDTEAAFAVAPSPHRPFLILAGDRQARINAGEVNILRQTTGDHSMTVLTVRQGQAIIYPVGQPQAPPVTAGPGAQVTWTDGQPSPSVRPVNAANAFAWESRRLAYDKAPLAEVIADLNRYVARPIRLGDPSLATAPFSGVLTLEGEDMMLRRIALTVPVEARPLAAEIVLQRRGPCAPKGCAKPARKRRPNPLVQSLLKMGRPAPEPGSEAGRGRGAQTRPAA